MRGTDNFRGTAHAIVESATQDGGIEAIEARPENSSPTPLGAQEYLTRARAIEGFGTLDEEVSAIEVVLRTLLHQIERSSVDVSHNEVSCRIGKPTLLLAKRLLELVT